MHQRRFKIIRKPELEGSSFLFNSVRVQYVGTCPETGISFYCNNGVCGVMGVRVYPDGRKERENATGVKNGKPYAHGKNEYLKFKDAFGNHMGIYASHAVWMAAGRTIPLGMTMDHIDGCTTNNDYRNLRCIDGKTNSRDGGFLKKLRNQKINPSDYATPFLLRFFDRMTDFRASRPKSAYDNLTRSDLLKLLVEPDYCIDSRSTDDLMLADMSHHMEL